MRFVVISDLHIQNEVPTYRTDSFAEACLKKAEFVAQTASDKKAEAIVIAGDMTHSPDTSYYLIDRFLSVLRSTNKPILVVPGNHDMRKALSSLERVPLGHYARIGWLKLLLKDQHEIVGDCVFWGLPFDYCDGAPSTDLNVPETITNKANILVTHQMLLPKDRPQMGYTDLYGNTIPIYTVVEDCTTNTDFIVLAHEHTSCKEALTKNDVLARGPGAMTRRKRTEKNAYRYLDLVEIEPGQSPRCSFIKIPTESGDSVFNTEKIDRDEKLVENLNRFREGLMGLSVKGKTLEQLIAEYAKKMDIDPDIIKEANRLVAEVGECA